MLTCAKAISAAAVLRELRRIEGGEFGGDFSIGLWAAFSRSTVVANADGGQRRILENLLRQHAPLAIVLDRDEDIDTSGS